MGLWLRVVAAGVLLVFLVSFTISGVGLDWKESALAYYALIALIVLNIVYWFVGQTHEFPLSHFYVHWLIDLLLITAVVIGLGRPTLSAAVTGYILIVVSSAVFLSRRASYVVASGAAAVLALFTAVESAHAEGVAQSASVVSTLFVSGGSIILMYLIAHIAGTLADQLNAANGELARSNADLTGKNTELRRLHEELDFHAKVLTHDIRSPMAGASGALAELKRELRQNPSSTEIGSLLEMIGVNLDRVHDMIEALSEFEQVGQEGHDLIREDVDIAEIWGGLAPEFVPVLRRTKASVVIAADSCPLWADKQKLQIVCRNLVANALRYVPQDGTGRVVIGTLNLENERQLYVSDNGPGLAENYLEAVFDMFKKAPQDSPSLGLGIGLALVRKVARIHRGRAWAEQNQPHGLTVRVAFPQ